MDLYREEILDHYRNPRNFGDLEGADVRVREANASCGDLVELQLSFEGSEVADVRFKGTGCALSIAAASMLTEEVKGKSIAALRRLDEKKILGMLGGKISSARRKCVVLPLRALQRAVKEVEER